VKKGGKSPKAKASPSKKVNWVKLRKELLSIRPFGFLEDLDLPTIVAFEYGKPAPDRLYRRFFPFMTTWSKAGFEDALFSATVWTKLEESIYKAAKKAWTLPKNKAIVAKIKKLGAAKKLNISASDVAEWYGGLLQETFLSSWQMHDFLERHALSSDPADIQSLVASVRNYRDYAAELDIEAD
jgi:hypothetical protein